MVEYDIIAHQYKKSKELPFRLHIERYTYFYMLGDINEMSVLDLACGEGFYSRLFKLHGAKQVIGVDISAKMIELAKLEESRAALGIEYIVGDVIELGQIGNFDLVVASYLLNYAQTADQLLKMCQSIYSNLKPGGRFVTMNDNSEQTPDSYLKTEKYGFIKTIAAPLKNGTPIKYTFYTDGQYRSTSITIISAQRPMNGLSKLLDSKIFVGINQWFLLSPSKNLVRNFGRIFSIAHL